MNCFRAVALALPIDNGIHMLMINRSIIELIPCFKNGGSIGNIKES